MAQNIRQLKNRIKSVENTRKITRAMQMVAAAKLNRVKNAFYSARPFFANAEEILKRLLADIEVPDHPLLHRRPKIKKIAICVFTSDAGLCGAYNNNVLKKVENFISKYQKDDIRIVAVGKEAYSHFHKLDYVIRESFLGLYGKFSPKTSADINKLLMNMFMRKLS